MTRPSLLLAVLLIAAPCLAQTPAFLSLRRQSGDALVPGAPQAVPVPDGLSQDDVARIRAFSDIIKRFYVNGDSVTSRDLMYAALKGMAQQLDPHCQFFTPQEWKDFQALESGVYAGIGVQMKKKKVGEGAGIAFPFPGSPASRAGLRPNDVILEVDGEDVGPLEAQEVNSKIKGLKGTTVTLKFSRLDPATQTVQTGSVVITRDRVVLPNLYSELLPNKVGYVYLNEFRHVTTAVEFRKRVKKLKAVGAESLIIDLRDNGGGDVQGVEAIASLFLAKGQTIVTMRDRAGHENKATAGRDGEFKDLPLKVLVNGQSASASEILSGALQDYHRAMIYGSRTYGKGSAQAFFPFPDGSELKLTVNKWYTPSGRSIQGDEKGGTGGITPDVAVKGSDDVEFAALNRVREKLSGAPLDPPGPIPDPVLEAALR